MTYIPLPDHPTKDAFTPLKHHHHHHHHHTPTQTRIGTMNTTTGIPIYESIANHHTMTCTTCNTTTTGNTWKHHTQITREHHDAGDHVDVHIHSSCPQPNCTETIDLGTLTIPRHYTTTT